MEACFRRVARELGLSSVTASFSRYSELKHTWSVSGHTIEYRISDYLVDAPEDVLESLAWYLLCRSRSMPCPDGRDARYLSFSRSKQFWSSVKDTYLRRSRNLALGPKGRHRDLKTVFDYVNSFYFSNRLKDPILAWTAESPRQRLGFYFEQLNLLAINSVFDSETVPRFVLEFVMFHELLHHVDAQSGRHRLRVHHTKSFKEQERAFRMYDEAECWLRRLARRGRQ